MADRGVDLDLKINRFGLTGIEIDELRLGPPKSPAFQAKAVWVEFDWKAPWAVELSQVSLEKAHWNLSWDDDGLNLHGLEKLLTAKSGGGNAKGGLKIRHISAKDATVTLSTKFGPVVAHGNVEGNLADRNYGGVFTLLPGRLRGPGLDGQLKGGGITARVHGDKATLRANINAEQLASAHGDAGRLHFGADLNARGFGGPIDKMSGVLQLNAVGADLLSKGERIARGNAQVLLEKSSGPVDRVSWKVDAANLSGDWTIAPAATFAGNFSGTLPLGADLDGRGGWSFSAPEAKLGEKAQAEIRKALMNGRWPDPLKSPADAAGASFLRAGNFFAASSSGDLDADKDGVTVRLLRADVEAKSGANLVIESAPDAAAFATGPKGMSGRGSLTMGGGGAPPVTINLAQLSSDKNGWKADGAIKLAQWNAGESALMLDALNVAISAGKKAGGMTMDAKALYSGPIGGGRIDKMALQLPAEINWGENFWRLASSECPRIAVASWKGAGLTTGAFSGAPCPAGGVIAQSQKGRISGRSDWARVSIPARVGDKPNGPRILLSAANASISLSGEAKAPRTTVSIPDMEAKVITLSVEDGREQTMALASHVFSVDVTPTGEGLAVDLTAQGATADLDGTTLEVVDAAGSMKGVMHEGGLDADITALTARVRDPGENPLVTDLLLTGQGRSEDGRIAIDMVAQPENGQPQLATIRVTHNLKDGEGRAVATTDDMRFTGARQPQELFPTLKGLITDVRGTASAVGKARWGDAGFKTSGNVDLNNLAFSTFSLGPVSGVSGKVKFDDLLKPSTPPSQRVTAKLINPGIAVENLSVDFQMQSLKSMRVEGGDATVVGGHFLIEPTTWVFGPQRQEFALQVEQAPIEEILKLFNNPKLKGTGILRGRIPLALQDGHMKVEHARLEAVGEGTIQVEVPAASAASSDNQYVKLAFDALRDLKFTLLAIDVNGDVDGRLENKLTIRGKSPTASNLPFEYNIGISAQILPLIDQARYIYDSSRLRDYLKGDQAPPLTIDVAPAPKE